MNLRDLEYLTALAEHLHFGRAAEASHVSQPTLSTQIKKLERELGIELFERHNKGVTLTAAGARILERAQRVVLETEAIVQIARQMQDPEAATLRIGMFPTLGPYLLPHVMPKIRESFPRLELLLVEEKTEEIVARLANGQLDAGLLALPIDREDLDCQILFSEDFVLAAPANGALASHSEVVSTAVLAEESVLLLEDGHCLRDQALAVCALEGANERTGFRATSLETLRQMVASGVGVTLLPRMAVERPVPPNPDLALIPFQDPAPHRTIAMFWRKTSAYRHFLPDLASVIQAAPGDLVSVVSAD